MANWQRRRFIAFALRVEEDKFVHEVGSKVKACSLLSTITIQYNHVTGSSVRFLLQSYKYIGSDGLQITATRLPQNAPNRIWNSKKFSAVINPNHRPGLGMSKGGNPTTVVYAGYDTSIMYRVRQIKRGHSFQ